MHALRTRLVRRLRDADSEGRFHAYHPTSRACARARAWTCHSKVMVVDDEWLRIGSSNISNRSMGVDTECDVVVEAQGDKAVRAKIRAFRDQLVAEHAGATQES
jgi:phosphatidylserine/phosphatidylglycerophosphate/cardiolipin synthase-like enzyme